jgi:hypothetical protein
MSEQRCLLNGIVHFYVGKSFDKVILAVVKERIADYGSSIGVNNERTIEQH